MIRWWLFAFLAWVAAEIVTLTLVADRVGWGWALLGLVALSGLGFVVLRRTVRSARLLARTDATSTTWGLVGSRTADVAFRTLAGLLLIVPGYVSGVVGLILLVPPVRALARAATGNWIVRRYPTMQATITKVRIVAAPGDVVSGQVLNPDAPDGDEPQPHDPGSPPALSS